MARIELLAPRDADTGSSRAREDSLPRARGFPENNAEGPSSLRAREGARGGANWYLEFNCFGQLVEKRRERSKRFSFAITLENVRRGLLLSLARSRFHPLDVKSGTVEVLEAENIENRKNPNAQNLPLTPQSYTTLTS